MIKEGIGHVVVHAMDEEQVKKVAIRVLTNIEMAWDRYLEDKDDGVPVPMVVWKETLMSNLRNKPLD